MFTKYEYFIKTQCISMNYTEVRGNCTWEKKKESEIGTNDEFTCFRIFRSQ